MQDSSLTISFGIPEHGWLSVFVSAPDFELELDASDAPVNPIEKLCEA
jgi:hypothetical protein